MRLFSVMLLLACATCAWSATAPEKADAPKLLAQIRSVIGTAVCTDTAQCKTLALGAKACGGPQAYLAWSTANTDVVQLESLSAHYLALRRAQIEAGEISTCSMVTDPGAVCQRSQGGAAAQTGVCQLDRGKGARLEGGRLEVSVPTTHVDRHLWGVYAPTQ